MDEFYGRAMPAPPATWGEKEFVDHAQLYGHLAQVFDESGEEIAVAADDWSENGLVQEIARRGGTAWYVVDPEDLELETPYGTVGEVIDRARSVGGTAKHRDDGSLAVHVEAAATHTLGGLAIHESARAHGHPARPLDGPSPARGAAGGPPAGGRGRGPAAGGALGPAAARAVMRPLSGRARSSIASKLRRRRSPVPSSEISVAISPFSCATRIEIRVGGPRRIA